jgi:hypothetical protein
MKVFGLKLFVFLLLIFLIDKPIGWFISELNRAKQYDNRIEQLFTKKINQELIILGSSRAVNGINAKILQEKTGQTSYNLGFSGSNLLFHKTVFNLVIANYQPKKILLVLDEESSFVENVKSIFRDDKLTPYLNHEFVLNEFCKYSDKNLMSSKLSWAYRENQNFFDAITYLRKGKDLPDETTDIDEFGSILLSKNSSHMEEFGNKLRIKDYNIEIENKELLNSFRYIVDESKDLGIELYILRLPRYNSRLIGFNERINELNDGKNIILIDLSESIKAKKYFFDTGHLNELGADKLSESISTYIN